MLKAKLVPTQFQDCHMLITLLGSQEL